jgi:hypothetical protein
MSKLGAGICWIYNKHHFLRFLKFSPILTLKPENPIINLSSLKMTVMQKPMPTQYFLKAPWILVPKEKNSTITTEIKHK